GIRRLAAVTSRVHSISGVGSNGGGAGQVLPRKIDEDRVEPAPAVDAVRAAGGRAVGVAAAVQWTEDIGAVIPGEIVGIVGADDVFKSADGDARRGAFGLVRGKIDIHAKLKVGDVGR